MPSKCGEAMCGVIGGIIYPILVLASFRNSNLNIFMSPISFLFKLILGNAEGCVAEGCLITGVLFIVIVAPLMGFLFCFLLGWGIHSLIRIYKKIPLE